MRLELQAISKSYGGAVALRSASLMVEPGTIHGIVGPNGAGKSTLVKIAAGIVARDEGEVLVDGERATLRRPGDAFALGIVAMPQELTILPGLSVAENIVIGAEPAQGPILWPRRRKAAANAVLEMLGIPLPLDMAAGALSPHQQRLVMFANALHRRVRLLILDEPTAALSDAEAEIVIDAVRRLQSQGISVVYVSHRFHEILRLCDAVTVIRDGASFPPVPRAELDLTQLVSAVIREGALLDVSVRTRTPGSALVDVENLAGRELRGVSLAVRSGEILGVAGLPGSGVGELLEIIGGVRRPRLGSIRVRGQSTFFRGPADALSRGIAYLPAERARAAFLDLPVRLNVIISSLQRVARLGFVTAGLERHAITPTLESVGIVGRADHALAALSGGNRQKTMMARCLMADASILVLDDPTIGVDVGARHDLHGLLRQFANQGRAVIVAASEMEELAAIADRVIVLRRGQITSELKGLDLRPDSVVQAATHGAAVVA